MGHDILKLLEDLLETLVRSKSQETNEQNIELYNLHIDSTEKLLSKIKKGGLSQTSLDQYFEEEGSRYGRSFLPNENGRIAEEAFWNLKKKLGC